MAAGRQGVMECPSVLWRLGAKSPPWGGAAYRELTPLGAIKCLWPLGNLPASLDPGGPRCLMVRRAEEPLLSRCLTESDLPFIGWSSCCRKRYGSLLPPQSPAVHTYDG
ncbi:hypothetical protein E2C01_084831 [Portunus trituberculatus]|uniref:Uncharacterized protein n=1 Tax=Portunus trituberculatus TaxID=210409 RepID=A0A5B7J567_PORTR|nr:hypothetical protein [Portunus trituberculatus]